MRKLLITLLIILSVIFIAANALAGSYKTPDSVDDMACIISANAEKDINNECMFIKLRYGFDVVFVTTNDRMLYHPDDGGDYSGADGMDRWADDYYRLNKCGIGDDKCGAIVAIDASDDAYTVRLHENDEKKLTDELRGKLTDTASNFFDRKEHSIGCGAFVNILELCLEESGIKPNRYTLLMLMLDNSPEVELACCAFAVAAAAAIVAALVITVKKEMRRAQADSSSGGEGQNDRK